MEGLICYSKFQWNNLHAREEVEQPLEEVMCRLMLLCYLLSKAEWLGVNAPELTHRGFTSQLCHHQLCDLVSYLTSLCFNLLICEVGIKQCLLQWLVVRIK